MTKGTQTAPGHMLIRGGVILAVLGVIFALMIRPAGGAAFPAFGFGVIVVGLLLVGLGYLQRIAARR
ncbi:MAG TPA: hypothetical protein VIQ52_09310 [Arthrobacter sp.]